MRQPAGLNSRQRWYLVAFVVCLDAVLLGPLLGHGSLHLLDFGDYPIGPHPRFDPSAFGFPPGLTDRAPVDAVLYWVFQAVPWAPLYLVPLAAVAPLGCAGFARLLPGGAVAIGAATLLFTVNPFVDERMANGQIYVVMGYSLLPILFSLAARPLSSVAATGALGGLLFALDAALSVHYLFISALLIAGVMLAHGLFRQWRVVLADVAILACGAVLSLYWLIPAASAGFGREGHVTSADLSVFATVAGPRWGLGVNVAGLYGFWRPGIPLLQDSFSGWPFVLLAILIVAGYGLFQLPKLSGGAVRALPVSCLVLAVSGGLLALGAQGPTGSIFTWLFEHLPGFQVMREPDKFAGLLALAYAVTFGAGVEAFVRTFHRGSTQAVCLCVLLAIPLFYGYTELWGFDGYARPSTYPASWLAADRSMKPRATALVLPWSSYLPMPWARGQLIANPMASYFDRPVIAPDVLDAGSIVTESSDPRSLFLEFCFSEGNDITEFGRVLAPLGVKYVVVAKVGGWQSYNWLGAQHDLKAVFDSSAIVVYENEEIVPVAYAPHEQLTVSNWGSVLALAQKVPLVDYLIHVQAAQPGPLQAPPSIGRPEPPTLLLAKAGSAVSEPLELTTSTRDVVITAPAYTGWQLAGFKTTSQFGVTVAFAGADGLDRPASVVARYGPWRLIERCDIAGAVLVLGDLLLAVLGLRRVRHSKRARPRL